MMTTYDELMMCMGWSLLTYVILLRPQEGYIDNQSWIPELDRVRCHHENILEDDPIGMITSSLGKSKCLID